MKRRPYPRYVDPRFGWLEEVPVEWKATQLKRGYKVTLGKMLQTEASSSGDELRPYVRAGNIRWSGVDSSDVKEMWISEAERGQLRLMRGDLLVSEGGDVGRCAIWNDELPECYFQNSVNRVRAQGLNNCRFLYYWLYAMKVGGLIDIVCNKSTIAHFTAEKLQALPVVLPTSREQQSIAAFLDRETSRLDTLIAKQECLIELLEEKKQAVISHAVTKGLDPKAPMKDSGIAWLGTVPQHWKCVALNRVATRVVVGIAEAATHAYAEKGIPILRSTNIRANRIEGELLYLLPEFAGERSSKLIHAGDLVTVRTGAPGVTAVVPPALDGCQCFTMLITSLKSGCLPEFFSLAINSEYGQRFFSLEGWGTAQINISVPILKSLPVAVPPLEEQRQIVDYLSNEVKRLSDLIERSEHSIDLIREHRSALISAAVTGKIDVRDHATAKYDAAPLPT